jgi:hypothetical protein
MASQASKRRQQGLLALGTRLLPGAGVVPHVTPLSLSLGGETAAAVAGRGGVGGGGEMAVVAGGEGGQGEEEVVITAVGGCADAEVGVEACSKLPAPANAGGGHVM